MKRTVKDKYTFNKQKKDKSPFSLGYCIGVDLYNDYPKADAKKKAAVSNYITGAKDGARSGDMLSKGVMCGVRDAANERKNRDKR